MTDREWDAIALLLAKGWKGEFGPSEDRAYRTLLDGYEPEEVVAALRKLLAKGTPFVPACSEIVQAIEEDPVCPTFTEAYRTIFGVVLAARPDANSFESEAAMLAARDRAAVDRAYREHPLLGRFVESFGPDRLRMLEVDHPEHGSLVRRDLQLEWERHAEAHAHRDAAELAAGHRPPGLERGGVRRLDPARALGVTAEAGLPVDEDGEF